jgi:hypothetical protein
VLWGTKCQSAQPERLVECTVLSLYRASQIESPLPSVLARHPTPQTGILSSSRMWGVMRHKVPLRPSKALRRKIDPLPITHSAISKNKELSADRLQRGPTPLQTALVKRGFCPKEFTEQRANARYAAR